MRRFAIERPMMARRMTRRRRLFGSPSSRTLRGPVHRAYVNLGGFRKYNGCGCRGARCGSCHPDRKYAGPTMQERRHA